MTAYGRPALGVIYRDVALGSRYTDAFEVDKMRRMVDAVYAQGWGRLLLDIFADTKASQSWTLEVKEAVALRPVFDAVQAHLLLTERGYNYLSVEVLGPLGGRPESIEDSGRWEWD